ncbi:MAG: hypothetical protein Q9185_005595 [Variospora sp. 1 TL-2023]
MSPPSTHSHHFLPLLLLLLLPAFLTTSLLIPPSLNHTTTLLPPILTTNLKINCYIQPPIPTKRLPTAAIADCYDALQHLLFGDKAMAPMHFSPDPHRGFEVPYAWGHASCQIIINNLYPGAEDTFQLVLLAHMAAEVMESCIVESPANLGGDVRLGQDMKFEVVVAGTGLRAAKGSGEMVREERREVGAE